VMNLSGIVNQSYDLKDLRVRSYARTRNMMVFVFAVSSFSAVYLS
jgi:hypothetical protein